MADSNNSEPSGEKRVGKPMRRLNPTVLAIIAGLALVLLIILIVARQGGAEQDRLSDNQLAASGKAGPEERCADQDTYDLIKRELFRRAAALRGSDQAAFDRLSAYAVARMTDPVLRTQDEELGTVTCEGSLTLDLPPGVAVVGGRRSLSADIGYTLQTAADGSGDVVTLTGADSIVTPLATLARVGMPTGTPLAPQEPVDDAVADPLAPLPAEPEPAQPPPPTVPEPAPEPTASPSFSCSNARTRGEIAVCRDPGLAALDRQMAAQFNSALSSADTQERSLLLRTRTDFLRFRDNCPSNACIAQTYQGRIREIRDIMAGRWSPPR